jgi:hypothetical protein
MAGDNDTDDKFFAGINNTGEQLSPVTRALGINLLSVSTTLVNSYRLPVAVTTTPALTFFTGVVDTGHK